MNERFDEASVAAFRASYDAGLADGGSQDYGYYLLEPQFDGDTADLVWLDLFADDESVLAASDSWAGSELEAEWNAMLDCQNYTFAATATRR